MYVCVCVCVSVCLCAGSVPSPHHAPAPAGPPGPPLPTSFFDVPGVSYAGVDNSIFARGFDAVGAEFKAPVVQFTSRAKPERLWAPPQYSGLDVVQVPDQVSVFTLPANQYEARGAYMFSYSEVELFANGSSTSVVSALLYESFATSFYEYFKFVRSIWLLLLDGNFVVLLFHSNDSQRSCILDRYLLGVNSSVADYSEQHISLFKVRIKCRVSRPCRWCHCLVLIAGADNSLLFAGVAARLHYGHQPLCLRKCRMEGVKMAPHLPCSSPSFHCHGTALRILQPTLCVTVYLIFFRRLQHFAPCCCWCNFSFFNVLFFFLLGFCRCFWDSLRIIRGFWGFCERVGLGVAELR